MKHPNIRFQTGEGFCTSIFDGKLSHACIVIHPTAHGTFADQLRDCFVRLERALADARLSKHNLIAQTIFLRNAADEPACRAALHDFFEGNAPAATVVLQPPATGAAIAFEIWATQAEFQAGPDTIVVQDDGITWAVTGNITREGPEVYDQTQLGFAEMALKLQRVGLTLGDVVRTWFYVGDITGEEADRQRYRVFNQSRAAFYANVSFTRTRAKRASGVYPASTGIGASGRSLRMCSLALASDRADVVPTALENPGQVAAYHYDRSYGIQAPTFSRAVAIRVGSNVAVLVSGTASIAESETTHIGDASAQTQLTLDNIAALISEDNLVAHDLPHAEVSLRSVVSARVYIKQPEHYSTVRMICEERLPGVPIMYVVADVCRPDLLVEIEGLVVAQIRS